jgi:hypothetical protein
MIDTAQKRTPLATTTGELFLPTRLVYEVYDASQLRAWLAKTSCMMWDAKIRRWTWNHVGAAIKMKFPPVYDQLPAKQKPVVLASCYLVNDQTFHVYTRCWLRAVKFLSFFDQQVSHSIAMGKFMDQYNLITDVAPGEPLPVPEDYFTDETKLFFFDLIGLLDAPESSAKKAALDAYYAGLETRPWRPLERHRLDDFYEDGPETAEQSSDFRELMAGLQYRSDTPIRPVEELNRLLAQRQLE